MCNFYTMVNKTPAYWKFGFRIEKTFWKIKYKSVVNEPYNTPTFDDTWMHTYI